MRIQRVPFAHLSLLSLLGAGSRSSTIRSPFGIPSRSLTRLERMRPDANATTETHGSIRSREICQHIQSFISLALDGSGAKVDYSFTTQELRRAPFLDLEGIKPLAAISECDPCDANELQV